MYGPGYSYTDRSPQGIHKREAEPGYDEKSYSTRYHNDGNGYTPARLHRRQIGALALLGATSLGLGLSGAYEPKYRGIHYRNSLRYYKREAEPSYAPALAYHPAGGYGYNKYGPGYSYTDRSPQGLHKREASGESYQYVNRYDGYDRVPTNYGVRVSGYNAYVDEDRVGRLGKRSPYGYTPAIAYPPAGGYGYNKYGAGTSYTYRSPQGLHKREAEPSKYSYSYGVDAYDGNQYVERYQNDGYGYGYHKRSAEPSYAPALAYHPAGGYGYNKYGPGYSYTDRSPQGLHKREASGSSYQQVERSDCYGYNCENTEYGVEVNGYNAKVDEARDGYNFEYNYGFKN